MKGENRLLTRGRQFQQLSMICLAYGFLYFNQGGNLTQEIYYR